jgi:hypothetical protein
MRWENPIDYLTHAVSRLGPAYGFKNNPVTGKDHRPEVPAPFSVTPETEHVGMPGGGWFQHWSILDDEGKKLKGGVMVKHRAGGQYQTTTYRDGVHVRGVHVGWLLSVQ